MQLRLVKDIAARVRLGHPWIYADALARPSRQPPAGAAIDVVDRRGAFLARGFYDPDGPIAVRVLTRDRDEPLGRALVARRVARACALRRLAADRLQGDALRLLHGEADGVPGFVLDLYAGQGVVRFDGAAAEAAWSPHVREVVAVCRAEGYPIERVWGRPSEGRRGAGRALLGDAPAGPVIVREGPARYEVDVVRGQKTGYFLDQRENRALVGRLAAGADVLNLFAYTGGFSIMAALGGARRVTTVDASAPAIETARRNLALNGLATAAHELVTADVFAFLEDAARRGRRWDLVVCDPPSFAPSERTRPAALAAYRELNRAVAGVVAPGGLLATASCSSHVGPAEFTAAVAAGLGAAGRIGRVLDARGAAADHPTLPAFPEGRYLKFLLVHLT